VYTTVIPGCVKGVNTADPGCVNGVNTADPGLGRGIPSAVPGLWERYSSCCSRGGGCTTLLIPGRECAPLLTPGGNSAGKAGNPATERGVAQGHTELPAPVSLLGDESWTPRPTPVSLLEEKGRPWPLSPY